VRPTARDPCAISSGHVCFFFFFSFFSFFYLKGLDFSITQSPWWVPPFQLSFIHRSIIFTALWLFPMHSLSSLPYFLHSSSFFFFFLQKIKSQTMASYVKPLPYILFQFILVFDCVIYVVYMGYFVKNLGFYFVMNLLKIPDLIRLTRPTRPKKPDPNRPIPAGFPLFYYCHGLEIPIPDWHGSGGRTG
jgi:hypothetical protein